MILFCQSSRQDVFISLQIFRSTAITIFYQVVGPEELKMERSGIAKLTNENFETWKLEVEFLLVREGLWKYIVPGEQPEEAADRINAAELAAWNEGDQKARATIGLLLSRSQHGHIRGTRTAKQVWQNLEKQHEKKSLTSKVHLLKRICDLKFQEGDSIEDHLVEFESLFDKLANAGTKLDNDLQVILVFRSLPSLFDALTTTLENRSEDELTMYLVKDKIINEANKRTGEFPTDSTVLKVDGIDKSIVCYYCQKIGHKKCDCKRRIKMKFTKVKIPLLRKQTALLGNMQKQERQRWMKKISYSTHEKDQ